MLLIKYLLTAVLLVSPAIAAVDAQQIVSNNQAIARELDRAKGTIEKYDGGLISNLMVGKALHDAKGIFGIARKDLAGPDAYTDEESSKIMDSYKDLYPRVMDILDLAHDKASECKKAGVQYIAQGIFDHMHDEKKKLEDVMKSQLSDKHYRLVKPYSNKIDDAFRNAAKAYQN
ncbi:hypothetical protein SI65_03724 [Aspergillus cristatus]|uniref:Uncharacterized protein n=1 Tax=Aspergillus cristatus TaxID=573508 RepID=A0A1E3BIP9_ASPCR|nr:hypothetical protein SI65_03724 [Aspergillus cristatus]